VYGSDQFIVAAISLAALIARRANVLSVGRKGEGPLIPKHCKLLPGFLGAAVSLDLKR
jgi:hypothetical protein